MNKNVIGVIIAVVALAGIAGVVATNQPEKTATTSQAEMSGMDMPTQNTAQTNTGEEDLTGQAEVSMDIKEFAFAKKSIKITKGTKVTWTNQDDAKHNAFSKDDGGPKGKLLAQGESYSFIFATAGTFNYICEPHPYMKGVVNVVE